MRYGDFSIDASVGTVDSYISCVREAFSFIEACADATLRIAEARLEYAGEILNASNASLSAMKSDRALTEDVIAALQGDEYEISKRYEEATRQEDARVQGALYDQLTGVRMRIRRLQEFQYELDRRIREAESFCDKLERTVYRVERRLSDFAKASRRALDVLERCLETASSARDALDTAAVALDRAGEQCGAYSAKSMQISMDGTESLGRMIRRLEEVCDTNVRAIGRMASNAGQIHALVRSDSMEASRVLTEEILERLRERSRELRSVCGDLEVAKRALDRYLSLS